MVKRATSCAAMVAVIAVQLTSSAIAQASPGSDGGHTAISLPGDDALTCSQILAEFQQRGREFDALAKEAERLKVPMSARTAGLLAAHQATAAAAGLLPGADAMGGVAVGVTSNAYLESSRADEDNARKPLEQRIEFAMARSDYLSGLHLKKCVTKITPTNSPQSPQCVALKAESDKLRKEMEAEIAGVTEMARNYDPRKSMAASQAAGLAGSLAGIIAPGLGGIIGSSISTVAGAAQRAQTKALTDKANAIAQKQAQAGQRISEVETEYEESCGPLLDEGGDPAE